MHRIGILLLLLLLESACCSAGMPPDLAAKWWQTKHDDTWIANRRIDWNRCATGKTGHQRSRPPLPAGLKVGALVHTGSDYALRDKFWNSIFEPDTRNKGPSDEGLLVSVVPYVVREGQRQYLVPLLSADGFEAFVPTCTSKVFEDFRGFPHYYSSVLLRIPGNETGRRARLKNSLGEIHGARLEFLAEPVPLESSNLPDTPRKLLRLVFARKEADFLIQSLLFGIRIKPIGIDGVHGFWTTPQAIMSVLFDLKTPAVATLRDLLAKRPAAWRVACAGIPGELSATPVADLTQRARFFVPCPSHKQARLKIDNFDPIDAVADGAPFRLGNNNLITKLAVERGYDYAPRAGFEKWLEHRSDTTSISTWSVPLRFFKADGSLHLQLDRFGSNAPPGPCGPVLHVRLEGVIEGEKFPIEELCTAVEVRWPPPWGVPAVGCDPGTLDQTRGRCLIQPDKTAILVWPGLVEAVEVKAEEAAAGSIIDLKGRLRPRPPFRQDDPWLGESVDTGDPCAVAPAYRPINLIFIGEGVKPISYSWTGDGLLPTFGEVGWPTDRLLPQYIQLRLEQQLPGNPAFETILEIDWDPATDESKPLVAWAENEARRSYPVVPKTPPSIEFDSALKVHWYPTRDACTSSVESQDHWGYVSDALIGQHKDFCDWARLMRDSEKVSHCAQPVLNRTGNQLELDFSPLSCGMDRRLILIAWSKVFDPIGEELKNALRERLIRMKGSGSGIPFNLLTIGEDRRLKRVLACEDLPDLAEEGKTSIRGKIASSLRFRSENLEALENLDRIASDPEFAANRIRSILYLTDGSGLQEIDNPDELYQRIPAVSQASILAWQKEKVDLQVLTTGSCATWRAMDVACEELRKDRKKRLHLIISRIEQALGH